MTRRKGTVAAKTDLAIIGIFTAVEDKPGAAERFSPALFGFGVGPGYFSAFVTFSVSG
jgi:hypothetical protein